LSRQRFGRMVKQQLLAGTGRDGTDWGPKTGRIDHPTAQSGEQEVSENQIL
jgi:hypothetical protein